MIEWALAIFVDPFLNILMFILFYPRSKIFFYIEECIDYPGCREGFIAYEVERQRRGSTFCDRSDRKEMCPKLCSVCK